MKNVFKALLFAVVIGSLCGGFTACSDDDDAEDSLTYVGGGLDEIYKED